MKVPKLKSGFAFLDVKSGRQGLKKLVETGQRVPVTIKGYIGVPVSGDDGESIEFGVEVESVKTGKPKFA